MECIGVREPSDDDLVVADDELRKAAETSVLLGPGNLPSDPVDRSKDPRVAGLAGVYLIAIAGWVVAVIGITSIVAMLARR